MNLETTTQLLEESLNVIELAKQVSTKKAHAIVWDYKVDILRQINEAFETGYFTGVAYEELWEAKRNLYKAEEIAGERSLQTYAR